MSASATVSIGRAVRCADASCGTVLRIVIDPAASVITHLAVGSGHGGGRLVPFGLATPTREDIELACSRAEFDALLPDQDQALLADADADFAQTTPPHSSAAVGALSVFGEIAPVGITRPLPGESARPRTATFDRVPAGEEQLTASEQVQATDGPVGRVAGLEIDLSTRKITHVLVDAGHLWSRRHVAILVGHVDHIGIAVDVALTRQQIADLGRD